jgi:hypothetical protein
MGLPHGPPRDVRFHPLAVQVDLLYGASDERIPVQSEALGALLIAYCLRAQIIIPRYLERSVRVDQEAVVLIFSTNYALQPIPSPDQETAFFKPLARAGC